MDRKGQLRNVAFGGDWAEAIDPREQRQRALAILTDAAENAADEDPMSEQVLEALAVLSAAPRMSLLADAFRREARQANPGLRVQALRLVVERIRSVVGVGEH